MSSEAKTTKPRAKRLADFLLQADGGDISKTLTDVTIADARKEAVLMSNSYKKPVTLFEVIGTTGSKETFTFGK